MRRFNSRIGVMRLVAIGAATAFIATLSGVSFVSVQEQNNSFCGTCHTQPESTYLERFASVSSGPAHDLASFHHKQLYPRGSGGQPVRCIDCHVGEGLVGRGVVVTLAAWDALKYVTGTARQPAKVVFTIQNEGCIKCHEEQVKQGLATANQRFFIDNHMHYLQFLPGAPQERCVDCHPAHRPGTELNGFQFNQIIIPVCEDCHQKEGRGPVKMQ